MRFGLTSRGQRLLFTSAILFLSLSLGWMVSRPLIAGLGLDEIPTVSGLLRAISYDPYNPEYHYLLGLYRSYGPGGRDPQGAIDSYTAAIALSPVTPRYWLELSKAYATLEMPEEARDTLNRAISLNPKDLKIRWWAVNLSLRMGNKVEALNGLKIIGRDYLQERERVFALLHVVAGEDPPFILKEMIPHEVEPMTTYLSFLMRRGDIEGVKYVWGELRRAFEVDRGVERDYINYLISHGEIKEAKVEWDRYMGLEEGVDNLVWDGGFEWGIENWGFGWRVDRVEGVDTGIDDGVSFDGRQSLRIRFDGRHNVDFAHLRQITPLEPMGNYTLTAWVRTEGITTTNGIFMEFYGINGCQFHGRTDALTGTNPWMELKIEVKTPSNCNAGTIRFRRVRSNKLDNLIGGSVWIDGVRLKLY